MAPSVGTMASGNLSLLITEEVSWETFPHLAQEFIDRFGGEIVRKVDTPVERLWVVKIRDQTFWLAFEDFPPALSLDSTDAACNPVVRALHEEMSSGG
jgi:hypothetical protein